MAGGGRDLLRLLQRRPSAGRAGRTRPFEGGPPPPFRREVARRGTVRTAKGGGEAALDTEDWSHLEKSVIAEWALSSERASSARDVAQRVEQIIRALLAGGRGAASIDLVAERMATSVRTLQRRLRTAGLSYSGVVQRARRAAAQQMLKDRGAGIGEVARALGYSDPAHFTRAFQRWTGSTPRDFRARSAAVDKQRRRRNP